MYMRENSELIIQADKKALAIISIYNVHIKNNLNHLISLLLK